MIIVKSKTCLVFCFFLALSMSAFCQKRQQPGDSKSCQEFVGKFYKWYLGLAEGNNQARSDLALKLKPYLFSPDLLQQLKEDSDAQEKAGSDLVSLDADPFIGTDGPFEIYFVERTTIHSGKCWAEVHGVWEGKESEKTNLTPELVFKKGRWRFVNFYFPSPSDPKAVNLRDALKADRETLTKSQPKKR